VVLPNLANAFGIFLMRQFIARACPTSFIEAARVDGRRFGDSAVLFQSSSLRLVTPAIAALALFAFVYHWNSYLWPLTVLQGSADQYPIVISLSAGC
jgi:multiple sugar transport system permease protein